MTTQVSRQGSATFLMEARAMQYEIIATGGPKNTSPTASVVVPAYSRSDLTSAAIDALMVQDIPPSAFEIVVVDNASADGGRTRGLLRKRARHSRVRFIAASLSRNDGPAAARNLGIALSAGKFVAFTDNDCVPTRGWLRSMLMRMNGHVGVAQGKTTAAPGQPQPLFNHFIETKELDGSYSTSNVCYRRDALEAAGGFDPSCEYWEDVDLGWRVMRQGWDAVFVPEALVHHQVIRVSWLDWLMQASRFGNWPAKAARYPEFRKHLFMRLWSNPWHLLFQAFVAGAALSLWRREFLLLTMPYLATFPVRGRLVGRRPLMRATANIARDAVSLASLIAGSIRYKSPVL
jgi:GT2 family glycosyltransferase